MDINMPHMNGLQPTDIIMSSNPLPILVVRAESQEATFHKIEKRGLLVYSGASLEAL